MQFYCAPAPYCGRIAFYLLEPFCPPLQSGLVVPDSTIDALLHEGGFNYVKKSYRIRGTRSKDVIWSTRCGKARKEPESQLERRAYESRNVLLDKLIEPRVQAGRIAAQLQCDLTRRNKLSKQSRTN